MSLLLSTHVGKVSEHTHQCNAIVSSNSLKVGEDSPEEHTLLKHGVKIRGHTHDGIAITNSISFKIGEDFLKEHISTSTLKHETAVVSVLKHGEEHIFMSALKLKHGVKNIEHAHEGNIIIITNSISFKVGENFFKENISSSTLKHETSIAAMVISEREGQKDTQEGTNADPSTEVGQGQHTKSNEDTNNETETANKNYHCHYPRTHYPRTKSGEGISSLNKSIHLDLFMLFVITATIISIAILVIFVSHFKSTTLPCACLKKILSNENDALLKANFWHIHSSFTAPLLNALNMIPSVGESHVLIFTVSQQ